MDDYEGVNVMTPSEHTTLCESVTEIAIAFRKLRNAHDEKCAEIQKLQQDLAECQGAPEAITRLRDMLRKERQMREADGRAFALVVEERNKLRAELENRRDEKESGQMVECRCTKLNMAEYELVLERTRAEKALSRLVTVEKTSKRWQAMFEHAGRTVAFMVEEYGLGGDESTEEIARWLAAAEREGEETEEGEED